MVERKILEKKGNKSIFKYTLTSGNFSYVVATLCDDDESKSIGETVDKWISGRFFEKDYLTAQKYLNEGV